MQTRPDRNRVLVVAGACCRGPVHGHGSSADRIAPSRAAAGHLLHGGLLAMPSTVSRSALVGKPGGLHGTQASELHQVGVLLPTFPRPTTRGRGLFIPWVSAANVPTLPRPAQVTGGRGAFFFDGHAAERMPAGLQGFASSQTSSLVGVPVVFSSFCDGRDAKRAGSSLLAMRPAGSSVSRDHRPVALPYTGGRAARKRSWAACKDLPSSPIDSDGPTGAARRAVLPPSSTLVQR